MYISFRSLTHSLHPAIFIRIHTIPYPPTHQKDYIKAGRNKNLAPSTSIRNPTGEFPPPIIDKTARKKKKKKKSRRRRSEEEEEAKGRRGNLSV